MKRRLLIALLVAGACIAGVAFGQLMCRSVAVRDAMGIFFKRGHLLAIAQGEGIYEADLRSAIAELCYAAGIGEIDRYEESVEKRFVLTRLISNAAARSLAAHEKIPKTKIESKLKLLRWQFRDEKTWRAALRKSGVSARSLRHSVADDLRARQWIVRQITSHSGVTEDECRNFYDTHPQSFMQPARFRANHLFLAAPPETPPDVVETKQKAIKSLGARIKHGEELAEVAAVASEDEATKNRGGDLGFFSESRMPADFFAVILKMHVGEVSQPIRTRLGFHIIQLTDSQPARQMTFAEARAEIGVIIENEKRRPVWQSLAADFLNRAEFISKRL